MCQNDSMCYSDAYWGEEHCDLLPCLVEDNESLYQSLNSLMSATSIRIFKQTYHRTGTLSDSDVILERGARRVCLRCEQTSVSQSYRPRGQICGSLTCFRCNIYSSDQAKGLLALAVGVSFKVVWSHVSTLLKTAAALTLICFQLI